MCRGCRKPPPTDVCNACSEINGSCTGNCSDAFVYSPRISDEGKIQMLKDGYIEGGGNGKNKMGVKIPEHLQKMLDSAKAG